VSSPSDASTYSILFRSSTVSDFSELTVISKKIIGDRIIFEISDANLVDGYYTLGTSWSGPRNALAIGWQDNYGLANVATTATDNFCMEAWVKWSGWSSGIATFIVLNGDNSANGYGIFLTPSTMYVGYFCGGYGYAHIGETLTPNRWEHIAIVRSSGTWYFYLNGELKTLTSQLSVTTPSGGLAIGGNLGDNEQFYGHIDEVRIWDVVRTESDIRETMCKHLNGNETGLVTYYRFDHESGNSAADLSGNENHATLYDMENEKWVASGAALGDVSVYDYTGSVATDFEINISHSDGDSLTASGENGSYTGIHLYLVNEAPQDQTFPSGSQSISMNYYWGVFPIGINTEFSIIYDYNNHTEIIDQDNLSFVYRKNNADSQWANFTITHDTVANQFATGGLTRNEIYLIEDLRPVISMLSSFSTEEDTVTNAISFTVSNNSNPCTLSITFESSDQTLISTDNISYTCDAGVFYLSFTPVSNADGLANIEITATDSTGLTAVESFSISVTNSNNPPVISDIPDQNTVEFHAVSIPTQITDDEGGYVTISATSSDISLVANENISFTGVNVTSDGQNYTVNLTSTIPENLTINIQPALGQSGSAFITVTVDDDGLSTLMTFQLTVESLFTVDASISISQVKTSSVSIGDYDNDQDIDILMIGDTGSGCTSKLFRNDGGSVFADISASLTGVATTGVNSTNFGDYDNDGDLDVLIVGDPGGDTYLSKIYRNDGSDIFTDIYAPLTPINRGGAKWVDYDNDGDLDVFISGKSQSGLCSYIYRNDGNNNFTDISATIMGADILGRRF